MVSPQRPTARVFASISLEDREQFTAGKLQVGGHQLALDNRQLSIRV